LVERDSQLAILEEALSESAAGHGSVVLVLGEAGMGKTSLVESFLGRHPEVRSLWGACDDLTTPRPLGPVHDIARHGDAGPLLVAVDSGDPVEVRAAFLAELVQVPHVVAVVEDAHWADQATGEVVQCVGKRIDRAPAAHRDGTDR
jgi:predicted ATPase